MLAQVEGHDELALVLQLLEPCAEVVADVSLIKLEEDEAGLEGLLVEDDEPDRQLRSRSLLPSWVAMAKKPQARLPSLPDSWLDSTYAWQLRHMPKGMTKSNAYKLATHVLAGTWHRPCAC